MRSLLRLRVMPQNFRGLVSRLYRFPIFNNYASQNVSRVALCMWAGWTDNQRKTNDTKPTSLPQRPFLRKKTRTKRYRLLYWCVDKDRRATSRVSADRFFAPKIPARKSILEVCYAKTPRLLQHDLNQTALSHFAVSQIRRKMYQLFDVRSSGNRKIRDKFMQVRFFRMLWATISPPRTETHIELVKIKLRPRSGNSPNQKKMFSLSFLGQSAFPLNKAWCNFCTNVISWRGLLISPFSAFFRRILFFWAEFACTCCCNTLSNFFGNLSINIFKFCGTELESNESENLKQHLPSVISFSISRLPQRISFETIGKCEHCSSYTRLRLHFLRINIFKTWWLRSLAPLGIFFRQEQSEADGHC